jgi:RsiW-degrading membrane proteinase PrsW (M82 family)
MNWGMKQLVFLFLFFVVCFCYYKGGKGEKKAPWRTVLFTFLLTGFASPAHP